MSDAATNVGRQESGSKKPANVTPTILRLDESNAESTLLGFEKFNSEPSPEEAETVSDEVLRWRDTVMKRDLPPGVLCRWYLQKRNGDYLGTEEPTEPVTLSTQHDPRFSLPFKNFEFGPYELTICVTVRGESLEALPAFVIQHLLISNDGEFCTISDKTHITELDQQEVDGLPKSPFTLLRLHRKVFLVEDMIGVRLGFFIPNNEYEDIPIMDIHYVEIEVSKARPIAEQGKWTRTESGDYAVTVYATDCLIHIELWDLREKRDHVSEMTPLSPPHYITTPFARTTLPVSKVISTYSVVPELALVSSISHFGTQVVLGNKERSDDGLPFTVLKCIPTAPMDSDPSRPWSLERTPTILDDSFFPMFRFHLVDTSGENDERFYICDGSNIDVYSIQGEWSHIYSLSMLPAVIPDHYSDLLMAMKGRYIPWMSTIGAISIWNLVTGKLVSHVFTSHSSGAVISNFSEDGSSMLVSVNGAIELYDTFSGIKLGVYRDGLGLEGYYQVQFAQNYFVANAAESSSKEAIKCDSRNISELCGPETVCEMEHLGRMTSIIGEVYSVSSSDASQFLLEFRTLNLRSQQITVLDVKLLDKSGGVAKRMTIPLGSYSTDHHATFVSATSQLVLLTGSFLHELRKGRAGIVTRGLIERREVVTIPISPQDTLGTSEKFRIENGFLGLINMFTYGTDGCRKVIIDYLRENVRSTPTRQFSSLTTICRTWTTENRVYVEKILRGLLPDDRITWVPDIRLNKDVDPLAIVLKIAKTHFPAIRVARVIMDYCVIHANKARNLAFLAPLFGSLYDIMSLSPDDALLRLGRITFIPAMHRSYILDNHMLIRPPQFRLRFWTPDSRTLIETKDPIMQLHISGDKPDPSNDGFAHPIFMASFDALWSYKDSKPLELSDDAKAKTAIATTTTWWKTLFYLLRLKSRLRAHTFVECYDFNLELFDNPAVAALVGYKCYNFLDAVAYGLPMAASIDQIVVILQGNVQGNSRSLSFSVLAVFLHMGGVWDPVSADFTTEQWAFHLMMAIFFFFTVILMLNVLIALINKAFEKGDDDWRLVWIESRLRFIESAENMSYHIPGFRQTHNWFPKEIYFSATPEQIKAYRTKYHEKDGRENKAHVMPVEWLKAPDVAHGYADDGADDEDSKDTAKKSEENGSVEKEEEEGKGKFETTEEDIDALNVTEAEAEAKDGDEEEQRREAVDVSLQVRSLESQVRELQKQLVEQLEAQQEQAQRQETLIAEQLAAQQQQAQRQYEELKSLLLLLRPL
ncbi:hypothetical protein BGZ98_006095 [Dissophora globulifera]|nr:hypothetical protein BGZ98_006095 [Dissophora globulifera]